MNDKIFDLSKPLILLLIEVMDMVDNPDTPKELKQEANNFLGVLRDSIEF